MLEGIMNNLAGNFISLGLVALLFLTLIFTKKLHFFISGLMLILLGALPLLYERGMTRIDVNTFPILNYAAYFFVVIAAKDLFKEAYYEKEGPLRVPTLIFAFSLMFFTAIPTLNKLNVIDFMIHLPPLVNSVIYILSGIFLIIGIFTLMAEHKRFK